MNTTKIKVAADTATGVYKVDSFDGAYLSQDDFYDSLSTLDDDQIIYAELDQDMYDRIDEEYGIH